MLSDKRVQGDDGNLVMLLVDKTFYCEIIKIEWHGEAESLRHRLG